MADKKRQTAVDWLVSQLNKPGFAEVITEEEIQQAKEIEKKQIEEAFFEGITTPDGSGLLYNRSPEDYYSRTFNTNEE